ncbi:hypothetical protein ACFLZP_02220 [Patescibacteria group bacterium]
MKKRKTKLLKRLLTNQTLMSGSLPTVAKILASLEKKNKIRLVYGETFDQYGLTIDSLKYYLFLGLLHRLLMDAGLEVDSCLIVSDSHSYKHRPPSAQKKLQGELQGRLEKIRTIKRIYNLPFKVLLLSKILNQEGVRQQKSEVEKLVAKSISLQQAVVRAVPKKLLEAEEQTGFGYVIEAIAVTMAFDLKVGPPRERLYDRITRKVSQEMGRPPLLALYLKPTFPLGLDFDFFAAHPEIEQYGLTPYKASSGGLARQRLFLEKSSFKEASQLVEKSFASFNPDLPNPVLDLFTIAKMAQNQLRGEREVPDFQTDFQTVTELKKKTTQVLRTYIFKPLGLGGR